MHWKYALFSIHHVIFETTKKSSSDTDKGTTKASTPAFEYDAADANNANQLFYDWQNSGGWTFLLESTEFKQVAQVLQLAADVFLQVIGQPEDAIKNRSKEIGAWATVHHHCQAHLAHTHPDNMLSAVYYVRMPSVAGKLVLEDPRGPRPPFDNRMYIRPNEGDIILFPSWLTHYVSPTAGSEERISIAFNLVGKWDVTTSIENAFEVALA